SWHDFIVLLKTYYFTIFISFIFENGIIVIFIIINQFVVWFLRADYLVSLCHYL
ncbi:hypothetical protein BAZOLSSOX_3212, partial [uncultured Gammaproteobacteria bacterium]